MGNMQNIRRPVKKREKFKTIANMPKMRWRAIKLDGNGKGIYWV
jgi:hypothetical protein